MHLQIAGLDIDCKYAAQRMEHVGYYRFKGYAYFFKEKNRRFRNGTTYTQIWDLYRFDRKLRLLTLDAIERIEVSVKAVLSDTMSRKYGSHWWDREEVFKKDREKFLDCAAERTGREKKKKRTEYTEHYYKKYDAPGLPPSWMLIPCLTLGDLCATLFSLRGAEKALIAKIYGFDQKELLSWLNSLRFVRNVCAHHGRLWIKKNTSSPCRPLSLGKEWVWENGKERQYFATVVILSAFLSRINIMTWREKLKKLFDEFPMIAENEVMMAAMGFPSKWYERILEL